MNSLANSTVHLEFFGNSVADESRFGEGEFFLGSTDVVTNAIGRANFSTAVPQIPGRVSIAATATGPDGSTSEFSEAVAIRR
jgi:hypothetical protein